MPERDTIITIDGPSGVGKSTVTKALADRLGYAILDSGALYRAVTLAALEAGIPLDDGEALGRLAGGLDLQVCPGGIVMLGSRDVSRLIRSPRVTSSVSRVSSKKAVRRSLIGIQHRMGRSKRLVAEGRDMGTVVFPDAEHKFYLDASEEERARRRHRELLARGEVVTFEEVLADQAERDRRDRSRAESPLRRAEGAEAVLTDGLSIEEVVRHILGRIEERG